MSVLSEYLKSLRQRRHLADSTVANKADMSLTVYRRVEEDPESTPIDLIYKIFRAIRVSSNEFDEFNRLIHNSLSYNKARLTNRVMPPPILRSAPNVLEAVSTSALFERMVALMEELSHYLQETEGIKNIAIYPHQRESLLNKFLDLPIPTQEQKFKKFLKFYNHCYDLIERGVSLLDKKHSISLFLRTQGLQIPLEEETLSSIEHNTYVEVYGTDFTQHYRSLDFFQVSCHSMMALEICEWWELFKRTDSLNNELHQVVASLLAAKAPMHFPMPTHQVVNLGRTYETDMVLLTPIFDPTGALVGALHFFKAQSLMSPTIDA